MKNVNAALLVLGASLGLTLAITTSVAETPKPKRINKAVELVEQGQPIYYTGSHSGTAGTFDQGVKDAQTYADYIRQRAKMGIAG